METFWLVSFWLLSILIVLPIPYRTYCYATGKVILPTKVLCDEYFASFIAILGLVGFFGYVYQFPIFEQKYWLVYLVVYAVYTILALFLSPKLSMISGLIGKSKQRLILLVGIIITLPVPVSIYLYYTSEIIWSMS